MDIKSIFGLHKAHVSLFLILKIWEWFHLIGLVLLFPKHPLHLTFFKLSPEKLTSELCNLKWENGDFVEFSPEFTTSVKNETFKGHLIKLIISGELPTGLESHQDP